MNRSHAKIWVGGLLCLFALANVSRAQDTPPRPLDNGIQVQPRGPLHDAIATPFGVAPEPGPVVPKQPPPPIPEDPPEQKPDLANVQWVPGYWAWDSDKQEYMWVSGVYRVPPQDRNYVPGYWSNTGNGWRWIPGFWASAKQQEIPYTPEPPASLDNGPTQAAPSDDALYVPGTWVWQGDRFAWRSGYWAAAQNGRVWVPSSYVWTPNGYLYVDGYWDAPLEDRGLMFAPVTFAQPYWNDPSWRYQPSYVLPFNNFLNNAFVFGPSFYFGNYYGSNYARAGYQPWYHGHGRYNPSFAHYGWQNHRGNQNWVAGVQQTYANRSAGRAAVPVHTAVPINKFVAGSKTQFVKTTPAQLNTQRTAIQHQHQLAATRQQLETRGAVRGNEIRTLNLNRTGGNVSLSRTPTNVGGAAITRGTMPHIVNSSTVPRTVTHTPSTVQPRIINSATVPRSTINHVPTVQQRTITHMPSTVPYRTNVTPHLSTPAHIQSAPARSYHPAPIHSAPARSYHAAPVHSGGAHISGGRAGGGHAGGHRR